MRMNKLWFFIVVPLMVASCMFDPQEGLVTVTNKSGEEVQNLTVKCAGTIKTFAVLSNGASQTFYVTIADDSWMNVVGTIDIEYQIGSKKFDLSSRRGSDDVLKNASEVIITIHSDYWSSTRRDL